MTVTIITFYWATKAGAFLQILEWGKEHGADRGRGGWLSRRIHDYFLGFLHFLVVLIF